MPLAFFSRLLPASFSALSTTRLGLCSMALVAITWSPLSLAAAATATLPDGRTISNRETIPIRFTLVSAQQQLSEVGSCQFWLSADDGNTWQLAHQETITPEATRGPLYHFQLPQDGHYRFMTRALYRDGSNEPEPHSGSSSLNIVIDRTPPQIANFSAAAEGPLNDDLDRDSTQRVSVLLSWLVQDPHQPVVSIDMQTIAEEPRWVMIREDLSPQGSLNLLLEPGTALRLRAQDLAGNEVISAAWNMQPEEGPTQPDTQPATPDEVANKSDEQDSETAVNPAIAQVTAAAPETAKQDSSAQPAPSAAAPVVPPGHQAVVAPNAHMTEQLLQETQRIRQALSAPSRPLIKRHASVQASDENATGPRPQTNSFKESNQRLRDPLVRANPPVTAANDPRLVLKELREAAVIVAPTSDQALQAVEVAWANSEPAIAESLLRALLNSDRSDIAAARLIKLTVDLQRPQQGIDLLNTIPPEALTSMVAVAAARAGLEAGNTRSAEQLLQKVARADPRYREAQWLLGSCLKSRGERASATAIWQGLSNGTDVWANQARQALQQALQR